MEQNTDSWLDGLECALKIVDVYVRHKIRDLRHGLQVEPDEAISEPGYRKPVLVTNLPMDRLFEKTLKLSTKR